MSNKEKTVSYTTQNTYLTQNKLGPKTKNVWLVFHGIGYLSRYFVKYFNGLDPEENYIIVPQAPSKYYLKNLTWRFPMNIKRRQVPASVVPFPRQKNAAQRSSTML